jgi:hypothetical protein
MTNLQIERMPSKVGCEVGTDGLTTYTISYDPQYACYPPNTPGKKPFEEYEIVKYGIFDLDEPDLMHRYFANKLPLFNSIEKAQQYLDLKAFW